MVSKINTRAERKVEKAVEAEAKKVHRKTEKLFSIAEASLAAPEGTVRHVVFPAVPGGETTLRALVTEAKADAGHTRLGSARVVENSNSANTDLFYGSAGIPGSDKEHQEVSMLCLHLLQSAPVFINTLLVQSVLKDPAWQQTMTDADKRGLSPLFWSNANLYGTIDMGRRLDLDLSA
ncbi:Tn3 family transposase [Spirillospora sp. CA-108201]